MGARGSCTPSRLHGAPHHPHTGPPLHHYSTSLGHGSGARDSRPRAQPLQGAPAPPPTALPSLQRVHSPAPHPRPGDGLGSLGVCG